MMAEYVLPTSTTSLSQNICLSPVTFTSAPKYEIVHVSTGKYQQRHKRKVYMKTSDAQTNGNPKPKRKPTKAISAPCITLITCSKKWSTLTVTQPHSKKEKITLKERELEKDTDVYSESFNLSDISDFDLQDMIDD